MRFSDYSVKKYGIRNGFGHFGIAIEDVGATEFLEKLLFEDKLRNIWQHVVHKAFNAGGNDLSKSLNPLKETASSMHLLQPGKSELGTEVMLEMKDKQQVMEN